MAQCSEIVAMLSEYLDRDLPPGTCAVIEAHLASCAACGEAAESLRGTVDMCKQFRAGNRPGPLPREAHEQMREAFERVLSDIRGSSTPGARGS